MNVIDQHNLSEIESLNQRGGRTLSFVDLIGAGTMTEEMVAYCWSAIAGGASFLTAARPGGAGKSTVLANLLALLPPGEKITTFTSARDVAPAPQCSLAHEIGSGHWYGYLWGEQVREFLSLKSHGHRLAACLHADTLDELTQILCTPPLSCASEEVRVFDLILFIHVLPQGRRVVALHEVEGEAHRPVFEWDNEAGKAILRARTPADYEVRLDAVRRIVVEGDTALKTVRENVLAECAH